VSGILPRLRDEPVTGDDAADDDLRAVPRKGIIRRLFSGNAS
jgi:hypothetical protein